MQIETKKVQNRRQVRYKSLDEFLADARRLAQSGQAQTLGNWSQGQIYKHLALSYDASIDGTDFSLPAPMRWILTLTMKRKFLKQAIPAGFDAPKSFQPDPIPLDEALAHLEQSVARQKQESHRAPHPAFGRLTRDEWNDFNLRHAEMHMSFLTLAAEAAESHTDGRQPRQDTRLPAR